jgi:O-antigen ligase
LDIRFYGDHSSFRYFSISAQATAAAGSCPYACFRALDVRLKLFHPFAFSVAVFGFYSVVLLVPGGYSLFAVLLIGLSLLTLLFVRPLCFSLQDRWFALALVLYPILMIPSLIVKGGVWDFFDYPVRAFLVIPLIVGLRSFADRKSFESSFFYGSCLGGIVAGLFSLNAIFLHQETHVGLPITGSIAYGQIAAILALISLAAFFRDSRLPSRLFSSFGAIGALYAVNASASSGALLGLLAGLLIFVILYARRFLARSGLIALSFVLAISLSFSLPLIFSEVPRHVSDIQGFLSGASNPTNTSQGQRLTLWSIALREIGSSPILGIGPGNFDPVMKWYCSTRDCNPDFASLHGVHNQFLDSAMNAGLLGLVGLMAAFTYPFFFFVRTFLSGASESSFVFSSMAGASVVAAAFVSSFTQVLYGHNISVLIYFFTITFLYYQASVPGKHATERD